MSLSDYVTLGHSGLRVSPLCLGAMTFGEDWGWGSSVQESQKVMDRYIDQGGNFIDTANVYTKGHSEKIIGDHIGRNKGKRGRLVLATKFFGNLYPGDPNGGGAGRKAILAACEHSLRRLQTDHIDLYWLHCWDRFTPVEETLRALDDLVRSGKVSYIGFSDTPAWKVAQAQTIAAFRGFAPLVALQIEYSLLERTVEGELIPMARELGLGVTPWSPLKSGVLSGKYTRANRGKVDPGRGEWASAHLTDKAYTLIDALEAVAKAHRASPAAVAIAWVQGRPGVASTIIGARTEDQLVQNVASLEVALTGDERETLDRASEPVLNFPAAFLKNAPSFMLGGGTLNGERSQVWPMMPKSDAERY
jgi:aryl-alcohol dehydrogenase-like predicted oxidoreductase